MLFKKLAIFLPSHTTVSLNLISLKSVCNHIPPVPAPIYFMLNCTLEKNLDISAHIILHK